MKIELELSIAEEDESAVMDKISEVVRYAKQQGFRVDEVEVERKDEDEEDEEEDEEEKESVDSDEKKSSKKGPD
jgi:hypothetical protein